VSRTIAKVITLGFVCAVAGGEFASAQSLAVQIPQPPDPLLTNLTIPAQAHTLGMWSPIHSWSLNPIHMVVMPDGRVVTFGSELGNSGSNGVKFDVWNPRHGFVGAAHRVLDNLTAVNSFCAASTLLNTGGLLTSGGKVSPGNQEAVVVNPSTNSAAATETNDLAFPRYYSTQTKLGDGRILVTGGSVSSDTTYGYLFQEANEDLVSATPEIFTPGVGWTSLFGAKSLDEDHDADWDEDAFGPGDNRWWYPRQWLAPNGNVFGFSARRMWYLNPNGTHNGQPGKLDLGGFLHTDGVGAVSKPNIGASSTAVMYDKGLILQVGGNGRQEGDPTPGLDNFPSSALATIININSGTATLTPAASLPGGIGRQWANATALPDGRVALTGGTALGNSEDFGHPVHEAALWNPAAGAGGGWTSGASANVNRGYHSSAVLLPNGTVLTGGGGAVANHPSRLNVEVYYPPYLFQSSGGGTSSILASRPHVLSMNEVRFNHGATVQAQISAGHTIAKAALIGLGSTTHSFDMGQRLYPIAPPALTVSGSLVSFTLPASPSGPNLLPPGYYYLFVTNNLGVPSEGVILAIGLDVVRPPTDSYARIHGTKFDVDGDGKTDLGIWRPDEVASKWYIVKSTNGGAVTPEPQFGNIVNGVQDIPVPADYDGDGKTDLAYWRPILFAEWHIKRSSDNVEQTIQFGANNNTPGSDIPVPGDYDGDGKTDLAVWRPYGAAEWHIKRSSDNVYVMFQFGAVNNGVPDIPVPADYDGDGKTDLAVWRPGTGSNNTDCTAPDTAGCWWIRRSTDLGWTIQAWGGINNGVADIPVPADYDGDGKTDIAIWRPGAGSNTNCTALDRVGCWWIRRSGDSGWTIHPWGAIVNGVQDIPVPSDYDGDGKADMTIFRPKQFPQSSTWWVLPTGGGTIWWEALGGPYVYPWGTIYNGVSDMPMTARH
jgi:hypothetical protein